MHCGGLSCKWSMGVNEMLWLLLLVLKVQKICFTGHTATIATPLLWCYSIVRRCANGRYIARIALQGMAFIILHWCYSIVRRCANGRCAKDNIVERIVLSCIHRQFQLRITLLWILRITVQSANHVHEQNRCHLLLYTSKIYFLLPFLGFCMNYCVGCGRGTSRVAVGKIWKNR